MTYIPHSEAERDAMLKAVGVDKMEDLFQAVPQAYRYPTLDLPPAMPEMEAADLLDELAASNETTRDLISFLGAGAYNHYVPAVVDHVLRRGEFYTAYTPYQPEISQGTLQAIFEYQSMICALTEMDVANASHYDGATAVAEAFNMAFAQFRGKRRHFVMAASLNPQYRAVVHTYMQSMGVEIVGDDVSQVTQTPADLQALIQDDTALVVVQYPDFFGRVFDYTALIEAAHEKGALVCVATNPMALPLLKTPGAMGADLVVGEGQPLGIPLSFGGPYLGFYATREKYIRKMAGRLVGETVDDRGQRGFVLTLTAREQHIKRERATSNICSNQGLMALAAGVYMSVMGKHGLRKVAELNYHKAHYAAKVFSEIPGFSLRFNDPFFNEFTLVCPETVQDINTHLLEHNIIGGYDLGQDYPGLENHMLVAVTEMNHREEIDLMADVLREVAHD